MSEWHFGLLRWQHLHSLAMLLLRLLHAQVSTEVPRLFADGFAGLIAGSARDAPQIPPGPRAIDLPMAVNAALVWQPCSRLAGIIFPAQTNATWQVRLVEPGERSRAYGRSRIFADDAACMAIDEYDALRAPRPRRSADSIYPVHTGQILGLAGRLGVLLTGLSRVAMTGLGASPWWIRRRPRRTHIKEPT